MTPLTGTGTLVRLILRRDRIRLPVWLLAILGLIYVTAEAVQGLYATPAERAAYAQTVGGSPAGIAMSGPPVALHSLGGVTVFEVNTTTIVAVALMAIFLTVRHTRGEEEAGRTELLRAGVLGRHAPLAAALLVVGAASLLVGAGIAAILVSLGLPAQGSLVYAGSIAALGLVFTALAAVAAQLTEHARGALGLGGAVLAVAFVLRALGDVGDGVLSWASPIGWSQAVHAFAENRWWPLALSLAGTVVLVAAAGALVARRDVGAGLVPARPGVPVASPRLSSPLGLAVRLQRGSLLGWVVGLFLGGLAYGSFGREVTDLVESNPQLADILGASGADLVDTFFGTALLVLALIAAGFTLGSVLRLRGEEAAGRAEVMLTTGVTRRGWALQNLLVTLAGTVLVIAAGGLGAGLAHSLATGDASWLPRLLGAAVAYVPAVLALGAVGVLLFGWVPRAAPAVWGVLAGCFVVGWLGGVLQLPAWLTEVSPYSHVPLLPAQEMAWLPLIALSGFTVASVTVGIANLAKRDIR